MENKKGKQFEGEVPELKKITLRGETYYTTFTKKFENHKKWQKTDPKKLVSVIPGTVKEIFVKAGDVIKASDKLLILEAMKMMNTIYSPGDGKIKSVMVKVGDRIPKSTLMIEFE